MEVEMYCSRGGVMIEERRVKCDASFFGLREIDVLRVQLRLM